ncbi:hypothetical protein [uncultured Elizabethkingia sp.]|uniref:hypothetical protein n=1 Tax=uncultured Elizabethkingia sp. TaxID=432638 RepID=UPI002596FD65|nr:hypothetical protein [uncultured Elizabethkingia sp.]
MPACRTECYQTFLGSCNLVCCLSELPTGMNACQHACLNAITKERVILSHCCEVVAIGVLWQCLAVCNRVMLRESCTYFVVASMQQENGKIIGDKRL